MIKYLLCVILLISSCQEKKDNDIIVVGTSADNPPYEFLRDGKIVGIDIEIATVIAARMNKKVEIKNMEFSSLLAALSTKAVDIVIAGMSVTPEREARVNFSIPYTTANIVALFKNDKDFKNLEDLKNVKIGVQLGSFWEQIANTISIDKDKNIKTLTNNFTLVQELKNGGVDALIMEEYQAKKFKEKNCVFKSLDLKQYSSNFAIVLPKTGSKEMKEEIDKIITELKNSNIFQDISAKWLNE